MFGLFYQPSTRTRISFESAMTSLGGTVSGIEVLREAREHDDEPLEDRVRVLCSYGYDVLLIRFHEEGGARRAAAVSTVPVVNAGDGDGQHPTQALLDAYTIHRELGRLQDIEVALVGDLTYERSVNSLADLLDDCPVCGSASSRRHAAPAAGDPRPLWPPAPSSTRSTTSSRSSGPPT